MFCFSKNEAEDRPEQNRNTEQTPQCALAAFERKLALVVVLVPCEVQPDARREDQREDLPTEELGVRERLLEPRPAR